MCKWNQKSRFASDVIRTLEISIFHTLYPDNETPTLIKQKNITPDLQISRKNTKRWRNKMHYPTNASNYTHPCLLLFDFHTPTLFTKLLNVKILSVEMTRIVCALRSYYCFPLSKESFHKRDHYSPGALGSYSEYSVIGFPNPSSR